MRHFILNNFRGIENFADVTNLDRGSLAQAVNAVPLPRGALQGYPVWNPVSSLPNYLDAFKETLDWEERLYRDPTPNNYTRSREGLPEVSFHVLSNKGALFMAGDPDYPNRVWIAEPATKRERIVDGLDGAMLSAVDILNVGEHPYPPTIRALSTYDPYILVHHNYGVTVLLDVDAQQDPTTGYRVPQKHTPLLSGAANSKCAYGELYLGYDGQIYENMAEASPPDRKEMRERHLPNYKATGGYEHLLAVGWQNSAFCCWVPSLGMFLAFVELKATNDYGCLMFHRPTLTLGGPFEATNAVACGNMPGTDQIVVELSDGSYTWADLGAYRERNLDPTAVPVAPPAGGMVTSQTDALVEFNWEDLGDPNVHKMVDEVQVNFQYGSQGSVALEIENERGIISGDKTVFQNISSANERVKFFTNINGRRFRLRLYIRSSNGQPWVLRDISVGFTPGVEL